MKPARFLILIASIWAKSSSAENVIPDPSKARLIGCSRSYELVKYNCFVKRYFGYWPNYSKELVLVEWYIENENLQQMSIDLSMNYLCVNNAGNFIELYSPLDGEEIKSADNIFCRGRADLFTGQPVGRIVNLGFIRKVTH